MTGLISMPLFFALGAGIGRAIKERNYIRGGLFMIAFASAMALRVQTA